MLFATNTPTKNLCVALVDGEADVRHARQLLLRSKNYVVRSYATSVAMLKDLQSRDCQCVVLDTHLNGKSGGMNLLQSLRASGWSGHAILLDGHDLDPKYLREAENHGDRIMDRNVGDETLLAAIAASISRDWLLRT